MSHAIRLVGFLALALLWNSALAAQEKSQVKDAPKAPAAPFKAEELNGHWRPYQGEIRGQKMDGEGLKVLTLVLSGDKYEVRATEVVDKGKATLVPGHDPMRMNLASEIPQAAVKMKAIVKLTKEGGKDILTVAYTLLDGEGKGDYPKDFTSTAENMNLLLVYERLK